jgi:hypothetical protein
MLASDFIVNGIAYNVKSSVSPYKVEVTSGGTYTGAIIIPALVSNNNILYSVTSIGFQAFVNCSNLISVNIPNSVTLIDTGAFANCTGLTSFTFPSTITDLGPWIFLGCSSLTSFHAQNTTPFVLSLVPNNAIFDTDRFTACTLYVPKGYKSAYQSAAVWGSFTNIVEENPNNIQQVSADDLSISKQAGKAVLANLHIGEKVQIYTTDGKLILSENTTEETMKIQLIANKTYIIKIGMKSAKVVF